jgi:hypothetical protein
MFKPMIRIGGAVVIAGAIALAITASPAANGDDLKQGQEAGQAQPVAKTQIAKPHRHPAAVRGTACSLQGWPAFEQKCQFDVRESSGEARAVRIISLY